MSRGTRFDWFSTRDHFRGRSVTRKRLAVPYSRRLRIEPLEDRRLLAVVTVDTLHDSVDLGDGVTSLREAIFATNLVGGADTIQFSTALTASGPATILLTQGELAITDDLEINGTIFLELNGIAFPLITIDASGNDLTPDVNNGDGSRVFNIDDGIGDNVLDVTISGLMLSGGDVVKEGGAIRNLEKLALFQSTISGNAVSGTNSFPYDAAASGGGIFNFSGSLSITETTISGNTAARTGGGIYSRLGDVSITTATVIGNSDQSSGGAAGIDSANGDLMVTDSAVGYNAGGGISSSFGELVITNSSISGNTISSGVELSYGNAMISGSSITDNESFSGGGILNIGNLVVVNSVVSGNKADFEGGGILNLGQLTITDSFVENNFAIIRGGGIANYLNASLTNTIVSGNSTNGYGAGINNGGFNSPFLVVTSSRITNNTAELEGGGIANRSGGGQTTVTNSTISGNLAGTKGGGLYNAASAIGIVQSTFYGNYARESGGGIHSQSENFAIVGSTITGNSTAGDGGGIFLSAPFSPELAIRHSTIASNSASQWGGGLFLAGGSLALEHTIVSENSASLGPELTGLIGSTIAANYSLIRNNANSGLAEAPVGSPDANGNLVGGPIHGEIAALLGPLTSNGGPTLTRRPTFGSPAINAGDPTAIANQDFVPEFDQRGAPFVRIYDGRIDIGALETQTLPAIEFVVDTTVDEADGDTGPGDLSLREAIMLANMRTFSADIIAFHPDLTAGGPATILLTLGELLISESLHVVGPGAGMLTIDASGNDPTPTQNNQDGSRIFRITDATPELSHVELAGVTLTGGDANSDGGAILNQEILTLLSVVVRDNSTGGRFGGGIQSFGPLFVTDSLIENNTAVRGSGGGISGTVGTTVINSTLSNNAAGSPVLQVGAGGAIYARGNLTIDHSILSGNTAYASGISGGGGIYSLLGSLVVLDSTISGNSAVNGEGGGIRKRFDSLVVEHSVISGNMASSAGGGVSVADGAVQARVHQSSIVGNTASGSLGRGGGLFVWDGNLTVSDTTISGNSASRTGGGLWSNTSLFGQHTTRVVGSTLSGNTSGERGGGFYNYDGLSTIAYSTITANTAPVGFGSGIDSSADANTRTEIEGSVVAGNMNSDVDFSPGAVNSFLSKGHNLIGTGNALAKFDQSGDQTGVLNPLLGSLADNGGPTLPDGSKILTHVILPGSSAQDTGNPAAAAGLGGVPLFDQRGGPYGRVFNGRIDIGAVELQPIVFPPALIGDYNVNGVVDAADFTVWRDTLGSTSDLRADGNADGVVNSIDYAIWKTHFGETLPLSVAGNGAATITLADLVAVVSEPFGPEPDVSTAVPHKAKAGTATVAGFALLESHFANHDSNPRRPERNRFFEAGEFVGDNLLLVLAMDRLGRSSKQGSSVIDDRWDVCPQVDDFDSRCLVNKPLAMALAE